MIDKEVRYMLRASKDNNFNKLVSIVIISCVLLLSVLMIVKYVTPKEGTILPYYEPVQPDKEFA